MNLRTHWPALAFAVALIVAVSPAVIVAVSSATSASPSGWCQGDENVVVCARQWLGTMATFLIGLVAAAIAWRAYQVAKIPFLNARIEYCNNVIRYSQVYQEVALSFEQKWAFIAKMRRDRSVEFYLPDEMMQIAAYFGLLVKDYGVFGRYTRTSPAEIHNSRNYGLHIHAIVDCNNIRFMPEIDATIPVLNNTVSNVRKRDYYTFSSEINFLFEEGNISQQRQAVKELLYDLNAISDELERLVAMLVDERDRSAGFSSA